MTSINAVEALRKKHRQYRRTHSAEMLNENAAKLAEKVIDLEVYQSATHVAAYIAILGEISVERICRHGCANGKSFYLPVLRGQSMLFAPWHPDDKLVKTDFGLLEPTSSDWFEPTELDLVLTPLVVFDENCNRIGQGGGYYDRTFEFTRETGKPLLLGVAHDSQREAQLNPQSWDIPLDGVVTEAAFYAREAD